MSGRILGIIRAYRVGGALHPREPRVPLAPEAAPETDAEPAEGFVWDGVYYVAGTAPSRRSESRRHPAPRRGTADSVSP